MSDSLRPHGIAHQAPLSMGFSRQEYWRRSSSSRGSSQPRDWTHVSCGSWMVGGFFIIEPPEKLQNNTQAFPEPPTVEKHCSRPKLQVRKLHRHKEMRHPVTSSLTFSVDISLWHGVKSGYSSQNVRMMFCSGWLSPVLEQCLAHSKRTISIYSMKEAFFRTIHTLVINSSFNKWA